MIFVSKYEYNWHIMEITLEATKRDQASTKVARSLRKEGKMPAVYYGRKKESTPISVLTNEFIKVWHRAGESTVVNLHTPEGEVRSLIQDVEKHPVTGEPLHADFYVFEAGTSIEVAVPLEFVGVAPAVKELGGVLVKVMHEVEIEALPGNLPQNIEVDITGLKTFDDQISLNDLKLPEGVKLVSETDDTVVLVEEPKEEEEETQTADISEVEVEKKGKAESDGEGESAESGAEKGEGK